MATVQSLTLMSDREFQYDADGEFSSLVLRRQSFLGEGGSRWAPPAPRAGFASQQQLPQRRKSVAQLKFILFAWTMPKPQQPGCLRLLAPHSWRQQN